MEPVAIVGMACRFPGAGNLNEYWSLLRDGVDAVTEVPAARWDAAAYYDPRVGVRGKMNSRWGGFLANVDTFDADFFGISAREARFMDPQQRLLMELGWEAVENAGWPPADLAGTRTGVFVGIGNYDYNRLVCRDEATLDAFSSTGTILAIAANRLSHFLGLRGPSMAIDTACSSSLVALHLACQSLARRETDLAIVGGVNLILSPEVSIILSQGGLLSPVGRCKVFDASADGYVRSEGCAVVVLKRLHEASADGDNVLAVVRGTAVNQDGRTHALTVTSAAAQQAVMNEALNCADVAASDVSYVEVHTPGTPLMDILEIRALKAVLLRARPAGFRCALGSVKTNIGNTEAASGIAGLVKVVLSLQYEWIPAHLHLNAPNPRLRLDGTPLYVSAAGDAWPRGERRRHAGVSAFGLGGTNAHVILEEAPAVAPFTGDNGSRRVPLPSHPFQRRRYWFDEPESA
jgi:acyl transferase domain-containing protein